MNKEQITIEKEEHEYLINRSAELRSLQAELNEAIGFLYPQRDIPLNHKIFFAVSKLKEKAGLAS